MRNTIALVGGAILMLGLATVAGWVGGSMSAGDPAAAPGGTAGGGAARLEFDELDRRLNALEKRLANTDENAAAALQAVTDLRPDVEALSGQPRPAVAQDSVIINPRDVDDAAEAKKTDQERADEFRDKARELYENAAPMILRGHLAQLADTSEGADDRRRSQVHAQAQQFAVAYGVDSKHRDTVTDILSEWMTQSVRDVGPYLRGGLERADYPRVEEAIVPVWDARDAKLKEILSDRAWKEYEADQKFYRGKMSLAFSRLAEGR